MKTAIKKITLAFLLLGLISSSLAKTPCQIIYDAGSSGTRVYLYQWQNNHWVEHEGPKVAALADPVRGIRGKNWSDRFNIINALTNAIDQIKPSKIKPGQMKDGKQNFDWKKYCDLKQVSVFATGGMRLAEQAYPEKSQQLWHQLNNALKTKVGNNVPVVTRTLSGFEEGLYSWLTLENQQSSTRVGLIETGGASMQAAFPCKNCKLARPIIVKGKVLPIYSYSILGMGVDEAYKLYGQSPLCAYGAGLNNPNWTASACANSIHLQHNHAFYDHYNYSNRGQGLMVEFPINKTKGLQWYSNGADFHAKKTDIDRCCRHKGKCFAKKRSCFTPIFLNKQLAALNITSPIKTIKLSWTLGAVICNSTDCLREAGKLNCRWLNTGCLKSTPQ